MRRLRRTSSVDQHLEARNTRETRNTREIHHWYVFAMFQCRQLWKQYSRPRDIKKNEGGLTLWPSQSQRQHARICLKTQTAIPENFGPLPFGALSPARFAVRTARPKAYRRQPLACASNRSVLPTGDAAVSLCFCQSPSYLLPSAPC